MSVTIVDGWIREAEGIYYTNLSFGPLGSGAKWIVLHGTAWPNGTPEVIANEWLSGQNNITASSVSAHIIIGKDGSYVQGISLNNSAWANSGASNSPRASYLPEGNLNFVTRAAIEHCKYDGAKNSDILTPSQQSTSFAVIEAICSAYNIPKQVSGEGDCSNGGIIFHKDCDGLNKPFCPGPYPTKALQAYLNRPAQAPEDETFNQECVDTWEIGVKLVHDVWGVVMDRNNPQFTAWRAEWIAGRFRGAPSSPVYPSKHKNKDVFKQDFGSNQLIQDGNSLFWI